MDKLEQLYTESVQGVPLETQLKRVSLELWQNLAKLRQSYIRVAAQFREMNIPELANHYDKMDATIDELQRDYEDSVGRYFPFMN